MATFESVITRKGQITLPAELRRRFNLHEGDRVAFFVDGDADNSIIVQPVRPVHERTYGVAARRDEPIDLDLARQMFTMSHARAHMALDDDVSTDEITP